jgi:hypothetical protein
MVFIKDAKKEFLDQIANKVVISIQKFNLIRIIKFNLNLKLKIESSHLCSFRC